MIRHIGLLLIFSSSCTPLARFETPSDLPARVEFTDDIFPRCGVIAVDSIRGVRELSAEFRSHFGDDEVAWQEVRTISSLIADNVGRPDGCDLTLFKAMGMGISDLALGVEILERARAGNAGHAVPERVRTPPRLRDG